MHSAVAILFLVLPFAPNVAGKCTDERPSSSDSVVVTVSFFRNPDGGTPGDDCPVACTAPINSVRFYTDRPSICMQWPGHSGENSAKNGTCHTSSSSFSYTQFTDCTCGPRPSPSGTQKVAFVHKCVVDVPPTLCGQISSYTGCTTAAPAAAPASSPAIYQWAPTALNRTATVTIPFLGQLTKAQAAAVGTIMSAFVVSHDRAATTSVTWTGLSDRRDGGRVLSAVSTATAVIVEPATSTASTTFVDAVSSFTSFLNTNISAATGGVSVDASGCVIHVYSDEEPEPSALDTSIIIIIVVLVVSLVIGFGSVMVICHLCGRGYFAAKPRPHDSFVVISPQAEMEPQIGIQVPQ